MKLIEEILKYRSVSIIGLEKNTGKTVCLNYILERVKDCGKTIAVTSIGIDGENIDRVTGTGKPEIEVFEGIWFTTSEKHFREKQLTAIIEEVSGQATALGRLITARAMTGGHVLLSGPSDTGGIKSLIKSLHRNGVDTVIVDGALSRMSQGAPTVTDSIVLATGAAVSANITQLVRKTKYVYGLIRLPEVSTDLQDKLSGIESGVWAIDEEGMVRDLEIASCFSLDKIENNKDIFKYGTRLFVAGAVGDKFLDFLRKQNYSVELIIRDFTRMFALPEVFYAFMKSGKSVKVLKRSNLLAICINPLSPGGYLLDSRLLCETLQKEVDVPVIDVLKMT